LEQDVFIHSIYSPNQMLTSRWWMGQIDPKGKGFHTTPVAERERFWSEVRAMYGHIDAMVGGALRSRPKDAYVVFGSDHGVVRLNAEVKLNNLFAKKGWLSFEFDSRTQSPRINWPQTQVIFLNMNHIFIRPQGLGGDYRPAKGAEYERLREEVAA